MEDRYDVIIVGAGPAGLACAHQLKNAGLTVLLVEKNSVIGPKICAGGLTDFKGKFDIPEDKVKSSLRQTVFLGNRKLEITLSSPLRTIDRSDLGHYQLGKIENSKNITILKETVVSSVNRDSITAGKRLFYFRYLVGADGSSSAVRKYLGLKKRICIGLCCDVERVRDDFVWYVEPGRLKTSYIWEFPHRDHTNIGIYFNPERLPAVRAREFLTEYLKKNNYPFSHEDIRGGLVNYDYKGCVFDNIFLAGDAAGLASKPSGEGISFALVSGSEIGRKILDPGYPMTELHRVLKLKKRQERILMIFELLPFMRKALFAISLRAVKKGWVQSYFGN
jgi:flavin-dependent dehydrogenase